MTPRTRVVVPEKLTARQRVLMYEAAKGPIELHPVQRATDVTAARALAKLRIMAATPVGIDPASRKPIGRWRLTDIGQVLLEAIGRANVDQFPKAEFRDRVLACVPEPLR